MVKPAYPQRASFLPTAAMVELLRVSSWYRKDMLGPQHRVFIDLFQGTRELVWRIWQGRAGPLEGKGPQVRWSAVENTFLPSLGVDRGELGCKRPVISSFLR